MPDETILRVIGGLAPGTVERIGAAPRSTVRPGSPPAAAKGAPLPNIPTVVGDLELRGIIGEGGMGRVQLAFQRSLGREVALKSLLPQRRSPEAEAALLAEGRCAGSLEHPNIVPVHALGRDEGGAAVLVMKRVEGTSWRDRLPKEDLQRNLEILIQVCNAVHFAHSRGVLHRDIKPDNVMLGDYGEVTLIDWGVALRLSDRAGATELCGTPCYLAPEMLTGGLDLSPRTDVYLLGATLYEILSGEPPHRGATLQEILSSVAGKEAPALVGDGSAPEALHQICQRALHPVPQRRFLSAADLRDALVGFLRHRASARIAQEALAQLAEARRAAAPAVRRRLLSEAQFGLRQALREWAENDDAARGRAECIAEMARQEIAEGNRGAAELLLAELPAPPADVALALEELRARQVADEAARRRVEAFERDRDFGVSRRARVVLACCSVAASFILLTLAARRASLPSAPREYALCHLAILLLCGAAAAMARRSLFRNQVNRHNFLAIAGMQGVLLLHAVLAAWRSQPVWETVTDGTAMFGMGLLMLSILHGRTILPIAAAVLLAAPLPTLRPQHAYWIWGGVTTLPWFGILLGWLATRRERPAPLASGPVHVHIRAPRGGAGAG